MVRKRGRTGAGHLVATLILASTYIPVTGFRVADPVAGPPAAPAHFAAYDPGFVGRAGDASNARRYRVNPGAPGLSQAQPNIFRGVLPRQTCPSMLGPLDGVFYCTSPQAGYCDRRSGACFCHTGYIGRDCSACRPTHFDAGNGTCVARRLCPNDCSGAGTCDPHTGQCACLSRRRGVDCSLQHCRLLDRWCKSCDDTACLACEQGYFSEASTGQCAPCTVHDPRCMECNADGCITCGDPLLSSVRRSGRRRADPPRPWDEDARVLHHLLPVGTQSPLAFSEAEPYVPMTDAAAYAAMGVSTAPFTFAEACRGVLGAAEGVVQVLSGQGASVTVALMQGEDATPRRYTVDCTPLGLRDAWYGFGAGGTGLEGPVEGAVYGSRLSPHVYGPGVVLADDGSSIVDVYGESIRYTRVVNDSVKEIMLGLEAALANDTSAHAALFKKWNDVKAQLGQLVSGPGLNASLWGSYEGYRIQALVGLLNTNDTAKNFSYTYSLPKQNLMMRRELAAAMSLLGLQQSGARQLYDRNARSLPPTAAVVPTNVTLAMRPGSGFVPLLPFLNASALACERGLYGDKGWACRPVRETHVVCGSPGTLSFSSPQYAVLESDGHVAITVRRTGGGLGRVSVSVTLAHVTTDGEDVSLGGGSGETETLVFEPGVVALTIKLPVFEDRDAEPAGWPSKHSSTEPLPFSSRSSRVLSAENGKLVGGYGAGTSTLSAMGDGTTLLSSEWAALAAGAGGLSVYASTPTGRLHLGPWANGSRADLISELDGSADVVAKGSGVLHFFNATFATEGPMTASYPRTGSVDWHARLGPHETFSLTLADVTGGASLGPVSTAWVAIVDNDGFNLHPPSTVVTGALTTLVGRRVVEEALLRSSGMASLLDPLLAAQADGQAFAHYATAGQSAPLVIQPADARGSVISATRLQAHALDSMNGPDVSLASVLGGEVFVSLLEQVTPDMLRAARAAVPGLTPVSLPPTQGVAVAAGATPLSADDDDEEVEGSDGLSALSPSSYTRADVDAVIAYLTHAGTSGAVLHEEHSIPSQPGGFVNGNYTLPISATVAGLVRASVLHAAPGGLLAEYWGNGALSGPPLLSRVEQGIDNVWSPGAVVFTSAGSHPKESGNSSVPRPPPGSPPLSTPSGSFAEHISARWSGRVRADAGQAGWHSVLLTTSGSARLWIDGELVVDLWQGDAVQDEPVAVSSAARPSRLKLLPNSTSKTVCTYGRVTGSYSSTPGVGVSTVYPDADVFCVQVGSEVALDGSVDEGVKLARARDRVWGAASQQRPDLADFALETLRMYTPGRDFTGETRVWLHSNRTHAISVEYAHSTGRAAVRLAWVTPAMAAAKVAVAAPVPARCLFSTRHVSGSPALTYVRPGLAWASGPTVALNTALGGRRPITAVLADTWGSGGASYHAPQTLSAGTLSSDAGVHLPTSTAVLDMASGVFIAGVPNTLRVAVRDAYGNGKGWAGGGDTANGQVHAQATLTVPNPELHLSQKAVPRSCGSVLDPGAGPAYALALTVSPRSTVPTVTATWITGQSRTVVIAAVGYNSTTGVLDAVLTPIWAGTYALSTLVHVDWDTYRHAAGSPASLVVSPGSVVPRASTVVGYGVAPDAGWATAGSPLVAIVQLRDAQGNVVILDEEDWCPGGACRVSGKLPDVWSVSELSSPASKGQRLQHLRVRLNVVALSRPEASVHVRLTALAVPVEGTTTAWNGTTVDVGEGVHIPVYATGPAAAFATALTTPVQAQRRALVFVAVWRPSDSGEHSVSITMAGTGAHVANSPYPQMVLPGPVYGPTCTLEEPARFLPSTAPASFVLVARDAHGNVRSATNKTWQVQTRTLVANFDGASLAPDAAQPAGGYRIMSVSAVFPSNLTLPSDDAVVAFVNWTVHGAVGVTNESALCTVLPRLDARYTLTCDCRGLTCALYVRIRGVLLSRTPWTFFRPAGAPSPAQSNAFGPGVSVTTAGTRALVFIQLRDRDGNILAGPHAGGDAEPAPWRYAASSSASLAPVLASLPSPGLLQLVRLGGVRPDAVESTTLWSSSAGSVLSLSNMSLPFAMTSTGRLLRGDAASGLPRMLPLTSVQLMELVHGAMEQWPAPLSIPLSPASPALPLPRVPRPWAFAPGLPNRTGVGVHVVRVALPSGPASNGTHVDYSFDVAAGDADDVWSQLWPPRGEYTPAAPQAMPYTTLAATAAHVKGSPGLITLEYSVLRAGLFLLNASLPIPDTTPALRQSLKDFPLVVAVLPGPSVGRQSDVFGPGTLAGVAGVVTALAVIPRDAYGNRVGRHGAEASLWTVEVTPPGLPAFYPRLHPVPSAPGVFVAPWVPANTGTHRVIVYRASEPGTVKAEYWRGHASGLTWGGDEDGGGGWAVSTPVPPHYSATESSLSFSHTTTQPKGTGLDSVIFAGPGWRGRWSALLRIPSDMASLGPDALAVPLPLHTSGDAGAWTGAFDLNGKVLESESAGALEAEEVLLQVTAVGGEAEVWVSSTGHSALTPSTVLSMVTGEGLTRLARVAAGATEVVPWTITLGVFHAIVVTYKQVVKAGGAPMTGDSVTQPDGTSTQVCAVDVRVASRSVAAALGRKEDDAHEFWPLPGALLHSTVVEQAGVPSFAPIAPGPAHPPTSRVSIPAQPGVGQSAIKSAAGRLFPTDAYNAVVAATRAVLLRVSVRDALGNARSVGPVHSSLAGVQPDDITAWAVSGGRIQVMPEDFKAVYTGAGGVYDVTFTPKTEGVYSVYIALNPAPGSLLPGTGAQPLADAAARAGVLVSPTDDQLHWTLAVVPSVVAADLRSKTTASGPSLSSCTSGRPTSFDVHVLDAEGNAAGEAQVDVDVVWHSILPGQTAEGEVPWDPLVLPGRVPGVDPVPVPVVSSGGQPRVTVTASTGRGQYTAVFTPLIAGTYKVYIRVGGLPTAASPYTMAVLPSAAAGGASSLELTPSTTTTTNPTKWLTYNAGLFAFGALTPTDAVSTLLQNSSVLTVAQQLDSAGIRALTTLVGGLPTTFQVQGTGSVVPIPQPSVPPTAEAITPPAGAGVAARDRPIILASTSSPVVSTATHPSVAALLARLGLGTAPTVPLSTAITVQALAAAYPAGVDNLAALLLCLHPPILARVSGVQVRLRDTTGAPLPGGASNHLYAALVRERLAGADALPTWSPWGPVEPPIASDRRYTRAAPFIPAPRRDDALGASGAASATVAVRGWAREGTATAAMLVQVDVPTPAVLVRLTGQTVPVAAAEGSVLAPVVPSAFAALSASALSAEATILGSWRLHVLLLQPSTSSGVLLSDADHGLTARFWRSRHAWSQGEGPATSQLVKGPGAVSFGGQDGTSPLWTRPALVPYTLAVLTGFLVPHLTAGFSLRATCDGPCSVELDGTQYVGWNGTHATTGSATVAEGAFTVSSAGGSTIPLRQDQAYAMRIVLQRVALSSPPSSGRFALHWAWASADWVAGDDAAVDPATRVTSDGYKAVPAATLYWGADHVSGSPAPVCVGAC